jgi:hypothetical protein
MRSTHRTLNKPLDIMGIDRNLFFVGLYSGGGVFAATTSVVAGLAVFFCFAVLGYFQAQDPIRLRLIFNSARNKPVYVAGQRNPFYVITHDRNQD